MNLRVDFTLKDKPDLIGRKAIAVSVSDIAACSGIPRYAVVSVGIPKNTTVEFLDNVFKGMLDIAKKYRIKNVNYL
jgi:thiamine-monophosphate kinase